MSFILPKALSILSNLFGGGAASGSGASGTAQSGSPFTMIILIAVMFVAMYFLMIRPQKKKQQEEQKMRDALQIGDEITTIGGIVGRVVTIKDDTLIIETGADRNKMKITRWAIQTNNTATEKAEAERLAAKEAQEAERNAKIEAEGKKHAKKKKKSGPDDTISGE